jgi:hypothetical protein
MSFHNRVSQCELGHTYVGLSKKQRLTELCCKTDASWRRRQETA